MRFDDTIKPDPPNRNPSRLQGWDADIDNHKRHALVDASGKVLWLIHPHRKGSINGSSGRVVDTAAGERIVEIVAMSDDQYALYKRDAAAVDGAGNIKAEVEGLKRALIAEVDEGTADALAEGYTVSAGKVVGIGSGDVAKYNTAKAQADSLAYPYVFSTIDGLGEVTIDDADGMRAFCDSVLNYYLAKLAEGVGFKGAIRRATTPTEVDAERGKDIRPRGRSQRGR